MALSRVGLIANDAVSNAQIAPNTIIPEDMEDRSITSVKLAIPQSLSYSANVTGNASINRSLAVGYTDGRVPQANLDVNGNVYISGNTHMRDQQILNFGTGKDLQIYHDGGDSYIADGGTGDLKIGGATNVKIQNPNGSEVMGVFTQDGAVDLYHNNSKKFETTSTGVSISGLGANIAGNVSVARSLAVGYVDHRVPQANLEVKGNTFITGDTTIASLNDGQLAGRRNMVINGDQRIAQRGASLTSTGDSYYGVDRFLTRDYGGDGRYTIAAWQTDVPTEGGFKYSTKYTCSTVSTNTGTYGYGIETRIEGWDCNRLMLGTAQAKPFTLSFWCKTSVGGTYTSAIRTASGEQSFVWEHTLAADTWTKVTKTILPLTSTLSSGQYTNSAMLLVSPINFGAQTSKNTTTLNAWQSGNYVFTSNQVHWMGNLNATFYMTGVQLEEGSVATPFEFLNYEEQFSTCQRYFEKTYAADTNPGTTTEDGAFQILQTSTALRYSFRYRVQKRAVPTVVFYSSSGGATGKVRNRSSGADETATIGDQGHNGFSLSQTITANQQYAVHFTAVSEM